MLYFLWNLHGRLRSQGYFDVDAVVKKPGGQNIESAFS